MPVSIDSFGNTSVTSIPLTLANCYGEIKSGKINVLMCGFGVGLSWGVVTSKMDLNDIMPIVYTGDYFKEGVYHMINPLDLHGKTVLITGASDGIGKATALLVSKLERKLLWWPEMKKS